MGHTKDRDDDRRRREKPPYGSPKTLGEKDV